MKLLAIDGNSIINRAFYGIKLLTTKDGRYTNGVYGFITILNRLCEKENPDAVAVAFDVHSPTFRHEKYAQYKAGRHATPPELLSQFPVLKQWLNLAGYKYIELAGFEADDILGTLSAAAGSNECVIATGDRDSLQLVGGSTRVLLAATHAGKPELTDFTPDTVLEKYGLTPDKLIDLKALMGDSSDNIPGVSGIGQKTATSLLQEFGSMDNIYENIDALPIKDNLKIKLRAGKDSAYLSRWLGTINTAVPICTDYSQYIPSGRDEAGLARLMSELEFFKLMETMGINSAPTAAITTDDTRTVNEISPDCFCVNKKTDFTFNSESGILYAVSDGLACAFDMQCDKEKVKALLEDEKTEKRIYDSKTLYKYCRKNGIDIKNVTFDTILAGYLASPSASAYDVKRLASEYRVNTPVTDTADERLCDAVLCGAVNDALYKYLEKNGQLKLLEEIEIPLAKVLGDMELAGFLIDKDGILNYGKEIENRIEQLQSQIYELVGYEFNLNSPSQLGVALFEKLGLPAKKKTKRGYSTSAEILEELKPLHPAVAKLLEYRSLAKLKSTYCDSLVSAADADGRIHSTFNQTETRTGRISSLDPNLQNIPVRQEEGKKLRKYFKAADGYVLCDADYSQIELRVLAHMANEKNMIEAFKSGRDFHTVAAATAFGIPEELVTPLLRSRAKAINFGIVYGIGAFSLAKDIGVTRKEAQQYIDSYLAAYPNIDRYMKTVIAQAKADGFVTTLFGRRRYLPELSSSNAMMRAFGERVARNAPIQGTAADIIKIAMIKVSRRLEEEKLDARLILQVHDELIVECRTEIKDTVCRILEEEMSGAAVLSVPLTVDAHSGVTWFDAKE